MLPSLVPGLLVLAAIVCFVHAARMLGRMFKDHDHPDSAFWLIRGGRALIVSIALVAIAAGLHFDAAALRLFGVVFLLEELYETGMVLAVLRWSRRQEAAKV